MARPTIRCEGLERTATAATAAMAVIAGLVVLAPLAATVSGCRRDTSASRDGDGEARPRVLVNGTGATFPAPLFERWIAAYAPRDPQARFNYQPTGSGAGERQVADRTTDFAVTDEPLRDVAGIAERDADAGAAEARVARIPVAAGAVAAIYNLPRRAPLRLSADALARIFLGEITRWDDPALVATNPGEPLPAAPIVVVTRADGSGTSAAFTAYLAKGNDGFRAKVGAGLTVSFPVGVGALGNAGVTSHVRSTPNALGYAEMSFARDANVACAALENERGAFVPPGVDAVRAALVGASSSSSPSRDAAAYPIAAVSYVVLREEQPDTAKALAVARFLTWVLADGQGMAPSLGYAPLPEPLLLHAREALATLRSRGKPLKPGLASD